MGILVPVEIWVMHPIFPVEIKSGVIFSILFTLFLNKDLAIFWWRILYVPAEPQHKWPSGISNTLFPVLEISSFG